MSARWHVLSARVPDGLDDEIAAVLGSGSLGVEVAAAGPGLSELRVYLGEAEDTTDWRDRASRVLAAHGLAADLCVLAIDPVPDGRWVERWQASLSPLPLGSRFVVLPTAADAELQGREPIHLVPGMAFGTGEHETTRLCASALERCVSPRSRWMDLGTGTGVLAIVAARCGASRVLAVDSDPEAARVASDVVGRNGAGAIVEVRAGSIGERGEETFDGIVANIQSSFLLANAAPIAEALAAGGVLIASGFLVEDVPEIASALGAAGLRARAHDADGPWACLSLSLSEG